MSTAWALVASVLLIALNAFFVAAEFALVSARRAAIEPRAAAGSRRAATTLGAMERVTLMLAGAQLGVTVCSLALGYLAEPAIASLLEPVLALVQLPEALVHPVSFVVALALVTLLHVVLGEVVPKNITLAGPDRAATWLAPPLLALVTVLRPVIAAVNWLAGMVLHVVGVQQRDEVTSAFTRDEVAGLVEESHREGLLAEDEHDLLAGALSFDERTAASVLLPLDRLRTVPAGVTPAGVEAQAAGTGFSRFPVRDGGALVGYLHLKDVLETDPATRNAPVDRRRVRPLPDVRATDKLGDVLARMQSSRAHLAQVTDATGTTLGVVALEDVLEELVGQIRDEARPVRSRAGDQPAAGPLSAAG
jgi:CBS domain containing-hemolysin-like protein